ncbi:MAG: hypothetical protein ABSB84_03415 [Verrucomicrobiota bacterium]|jgi:Tfp pilus assembly protein PilX
MQILFKSIRRNNRGYALVITMFFLLVILTVFASMMYMIASNATVTRRNSLYNTSESAAEAAVDTVISQMDRDFLYQTLNNASVYQVLPIPATNWPVTFQFSGTNGSAAGQITVTVVPQNWTTNWGLLNSSQFSGLNAAVANCTVTATATPLNQGYGMSSTVQEQFQLAAIPVFQYGAFYNMDMDISPGQAMTMNGKVMVNGNIWMCPQAQMIFNDTVSATLLVTNHDNPNDQQTLTFISGDLTYNGGQPVSHHDSLVMPVAGSNTGLTNPEAILNLPPAGLGVPNDAAYASSNQTYLYNECDLIISNSASGTNGKSWFGTNLSVYYSDYNNLSGRLLLLTNNFYVITNRPALSWFSTNVVSPSTSTNLNNVTNVIFAGYSFVTNTLFYDFRECATVQVVQIDVAKFNIWLTDTTTYGGYTWNYQCGGTDGAHGNKGHPIDSIYVYNAVTPISKYWLPGVRVVNGWQLASAKGLTIATPQPLYVQGNYNVQTNASAGVSQMSANTTNTAYTYPAGLMGDSITILSSNWSDSTSLIKSGSSYNAPESGTGNRVVNGNITVNAACLEGIVPSTLAGTKKQYSGGLENFLRLNEDWGANSISLWYNGSIVVMFQSIYATNFWIGPSDRSGYPNHNYTVPTRKWGFDAKLATLAGQPPCTPQVKWIVRGQWGDWNAY